MEKKTFDAAESHAEIRERLIAVIAHADAEGCPLAYPGARDAREVWGEMADIALRRWRTFDRRNKKKRSGRADRMEDLAKGLRDAGDMDRHLIGPLMEDYRYLAGELASVLETVKV